MSTKLPTEAQLHIAGPDGEYIFVHPETNFSQVIDGTSGKTLTQVLSEINSGSDLQIEKIPFSTVAVSNGQTDFEFADPNYDELKSTVTVYLNGEFMHPIEEYTVIKEVGKNPKVVLQTGVKANDRIFIIVERGVIIEESTEPAYPPLSNGYVPTGKKYGVSIHKAEPDPTIRVQYIEDAVGMTPVKMNYTTGVFDYGSWADVWFIRNNYPVMLNPDGTEAYKLNPKDYSKKLDGTASNINSTSHLLNAMSHIPRVYIKQWQDATHEFILVSDVKHDDTWNAFAHTDDKGVVKESLYLSIYKGYKHTTSGLNYIRSLSGQTLSFVATADQDMSQAKTNGAGWDLRSWSQRNLINSLLTIIGKSEDSQTVFGNGNVSSSVSTRLASGTLDTRGQFYGTPDIITQVKVFHMEAWWGDAYERITGLVAKLGNIQVKMSGPYNFIGTGFSPSGTIFTSNDTGYVKEMTTNQYGRIPKVLTGASDKTYTTDYTGIFVDKTYVPYVGGSRDAGYTAGMNYLYIGTEASFVSTHIGIGLSFI